MFDNFVSLGSNCAVASSMSKFGLRGWSGPFDWIITSSFEWVLHFMDTGFEYFLEKENLEQSKKNPKEFKDKQSGFYFLHEGEDLLGEKYNEVQQKYLRRIERFLEKAEKPTCYLRWIGNLEEVEYINRNHGYINRIIKKRNSQSEIVFVIRNGLEISEPIAFRNYIMPYFDSNLEVSRETLRGVFDSADDFLSYCASNYSVESMMKNLVFDRRQEDKLHKQRDLELKTYKISAQRYELLARLLENKIDFTLIPSQVIIYGAGNVGKLFYEKVKDKCNIICFIDKEKAGQVIDEVLVRGLEDIEYNKDMTFIITATYDFENICNDIQVRMGKFDAVKIVSLRNVLLD